MIISGQMNAALNEQIGNELHVEEYLARHRALPSAAEL
jgi:hypothetical protein